MQVSLDGYIEGPNGEFDWPIVEDDLHRYFNDQLRSADTFLYGRKVYEMMAWFWPTVEDNPDASPRHVDYARIWKPMPKTAFSNTLDNAEWNTRIVGSADLIEAVNALKAQPDTHHVLFGGAAIAATFQQHDLIDDFRLFVHPVQDVQAAGHHRVGELSEYDRQGRGHQVALEHAGPPFPARRYVGVLGS